MHLGQIVEQRQGQLRHLGRMRLGHPKPLAEGNRRYEEKFGYLFIVCATGKTAAEMLALLQQRLKNDPEHELAVAAGEQEKITRLRLEKL